jgi:NADH:ubiquinone oxidoreductase subunit C
MARLFRFNPIKLRFNSLNACSLDLHLITNNLFLILITFAKYLQKSCSLFIINIAINTDLLEITTTKKYILNLLKYLKNHSLIQYNLLVDYTVVDYPGKLLRFELVILLLSTIFNTRIKIRYFTNELISILTITHLYKIAFWLEREIWDMFGILFQNNSDLRRLLTDYGFLGHPLRKDFPLSGYTEIYFDDFKRNIIYNKVSLAQEYRFYEFKNPWIS